MSRALIYASILIGLAAADVRADTWQASRLWAVASDDHTWIVGANDSADSALPILQIWYAKNKTESTTPSLLPTLPPISGNPIALAADAEGLRVLFADLNQVDYFPNKPLSPGPSWQDQCRRPPLAWCGDATKPVLWAIVSAADLIYPTTHDTLDDETDADDNRETQPILTAPQESGHVLLRLERGAWSRLDAATAAAGADRIWMAARDDAVYLFWQQGNEIYNSVLNQNAADAAAWTDPRHVLRDKVVRYGWAGVTPSGPLFVAAVSSGTDNTLHLHVFAPDADGRWDRRVIVRENLEYMEIDPVRVSVAVSNTQLTLARIAAEGTVEFGVCDIETWSPVRFEPLSLRRPDLTRPTSWRDTMALMLALAILTIVMWTRRQQLTTPIELPPGLIPSAVWRRIMATFLDFAPSALLMMPLALRAVPELSQSDGLSMFREQWDDPAIQERLLPIHYAMVAAYGLWCLIWEMLISTTPGKYLFGCRVISVSGDKPLPRQLVVRNLIRVIMVSIGPPGWIITLMMMGMLSRNRQRVGDLMAGTMVVEEGAPIEDQQPPEDPQDGQFG